MDVGPPNTNAGGSTDPDKQERVHAKARWGSREEGEWQT